MRILEYMHTENECYKAGKTIKPIGFLLHSTGANNPYLSRYVGSSPELGVNKYGNHWNIPRPDGMQKACHGFIGKLADESVATCQTLPWHFRGWHAGGKGNDFLIGVELCEDDLSNEKYFLDCYNEAVELVQMLQTKFCFSIDNVIDHTEAHKRGLASNHADVKHWFARFGYTMDDFRNSVLNATPNKPQPDELFRVRLDWNNPQSQIGAYKNIENAKKATDTANNRSKYHVYDNNGKLIY